MDENRRLNDCCLLKLWYRQTNERNKEDIKVIEKDGKTLGGGCFSSRKFSVNFACGKSVILNGFALHLDTVTRVEGSHVAAVLHDDGMNKVFVEMVDVFEDAALCGCRDTDVVNEGEVLDVFAEADATGVWADRHIEFLGHQEDREDFIDTGDTARVDLAKVNGVGLEELLKDDAVLDVLAGGDARAWVKRFANSGVAKHVVGRSGLFNKVGLEWQQILHPADGLVHVPDLVGVHHQHTVVADFFADQGSTTDIGFFISADLLLEVSEALRLGFTAKTSHLFITVA